MFARLNYLLTYEEGLRVALTGRAKELLRGELYTGISRQAFWESDVASVF